MKKKYTYILLYLVFLLTYFLYFNHNIEWLQGGETSALWYTIKSIMIALLLATTSILVVTLVIERKGAAPYFTKLYTYRSLLYQLVRRDFKAKYKRSVLGILWTILNPLLIMLVLTVVFSTLFRFDIENYPVYLLSGQIIYGFFSEATTMSMGSILGGAAMIKKVSLPKYVFPVSRTLSSLVNLGLSFFALLIVMVLTRVPIRWTILLSIIPIIYLFLFALGVGMVLSAAIVFFRDIGYLYNILLTALMYFTPIFYPINIIPDKFRLIISLNPMYHFVEFFRTVAIYGGFPTPWQNIVCATLSLISLLIGLYVFYRQQDRFILYI